MHPNQPTKKFVPKGHDAVLNAIQRTGCLFTIFFVNSQAEENVKLVARDRYTVTVETIVHGKKTKVTYFKSAIKGFSNPEGLKLGGE